MRSVAVALLVVLPGCNPSEPSALERTAIERAKAYRDHAEECFNEVGVGAAQSGAARAFDRSGPCVKALKLKQEIDLTPINWTSQRQSDEALEAWAGGNNLMLRALVHVQCADPKPSDLTPRERTLCEARDFADTLAAKKLSHQQRK